MANYKDYVAETVVLSTNETTKVDGGYKFQETVEHFIKDEDHDRYIAALEAEKTTLESANLTDDLNATMQALADAQAIKNA